MGRRFDDETVDATVVVRNEGASTLHLNRVDVNCGCVRLGQWPREVAPGASASLRLELRFAGMSGPLARAISFDSDDPARGVARIRLDGEIVPRLAADPPRLRLEPAALDATVRAALTVRANDGASLDGVTAWSASRNLSVGAIREGDVVRVTVEAPPFEDDFLASVVLRRGGYERIVPVQAIAARDVRVVPARLETGLLRPGEPLVARLVGRKGASWRVVAVESEREDLVGEVEDGVLRVRVGEDAPEGAFAGAVTLVLEGARPERIRVPVKAVVRR